MSDPDPPIPPPPPPPPPASSARVFLEAYRRVRAPEGFSPGEPDLVRALPFRDATGRNPSLWRHRALHYLVLRAALRLRPEVRRVLDLGAGNGWMARRLACRYQVTAFDLDAGATGLGLLRAAGGPAGDPSAARVRLVQGSLGALPFAAGAFDAVVCAAALHHADDLLATLSEVARVLVPRGVFLVADSPLYPDAVSRGRAQQRTRRHHEEHGAPELGRHCHALLRAELDGPGLFRFVTLAPGGLLRAALARLRGEPGRARLPVLLGLRR